MKKTGDFSHRTQPNPI